MILFLILMSCDNNVVFEENENIEEEVWNIDDAYVFKANINDIRQFYDIYINLQLKKDFLTNNLWLFIQSESPSKNRQTDTVMYYITDEFGRWYGNERGEYAEYKLLYKPAIRFPEEGEYSFTLKHGMRINDLPLIKSLGITIQKTQLPEHENSEE